MGLYSHSKAEAIVNQSDNDDVFESIYTKLYQTYKNIQEKVQAELLIQSYNIIYISKYNPLANSSYIKLLKELDHPRKRLINIQNIDDNECFKCFSQILTSCRP